MKTSNENSAHGYTEGSEVPMDKAMHSEFEGHTPGPWANTDGFIYSNATEDRETIAQLHTHYIIDRNSMGTREYDNLEANAKLIAAAPDLLKENQSLRSELQKQKELNEQLQKRIDEDWYVVELNKDLAKQKELNAELVEGLEAVKAWTDGGETGDNIPYPFDLVESLIKKSKPT